jgi:hypothetical protein
MIMLVTSFFAWWYGQGWKKVAASFKPRLSGVSAAFSVGQLSRTMFAPWRRITTDPGRSLEEKARALGDNVFSRAIGFTVRVIVLFGAFITVVVVAVLTAVEVIIWPLLPLAVPGCLIAGLVA